MHGLRDKGDAQIEKIERLWATGAGALSAASDFAAAVVIKSSVILKGGAIKGNLEASANNSQARWLIENN